MNNPLARRLAWVFISSCGVIQASAQDQPSLSGSWVLVDAPRVGANRGSVNTAAPPQDLGMLDTISGAAFNCGRECSITHQGQALTIEKALLASSRAVPTVVLQLDGRQANVVDSFNPNRELSVSASWKGNKLEIVSGTGARAKTQILSITAGQLVVVSTSATPAAKPITFTYKKK